MSKDRAFPTKFFPMVWRGIHFNAEDAEVFAKDAKVISLRASARTFATSAFKTGVHWVAAPPRWVLLRQKASMTPEAALEKQIEIYRRMSGEERLLIGLRLHELSCEVARDGIRAQFTNANPTQVEEKLRERLRLAYEL